MMGLSTSVSISLACAFVAGKKRVPRPAAGKTAFRTAVFACPSRRGSVVGRAATSEVIVLLVCLIGRSPAEGEGEVRCPNPRDQEVGLMLTGSASRSSSSGYVHDVIAHTKAKNPSE